MIKYKLILALPVAGLLMTETYASGPLYDREGRPSVSMVYDPNLAEQDVTASNVEDHLDNLAVALMEGREDLLAEMDSKDNKMNKKEIAAAKNYMATMGKYEKAALKAALKERKNSYALKQVLQILQGKL